MSEDFSTDMPLKWLLLVQAVSLVLALWIATGTGAAYAAMAGIGVGSTVNSVSFGYALKRGHLHRRGQCTTSAAGRGEK